MRGPAYRPEQPVFHATPFYTGKRPSILLSFHPSPSRSNDIPDTEVLFPGVTVSLNHIPGEKGLCLNCSCSLGCPQLGKVWPTAVPQ